MSEIKTTSEFVIREAALKTWVRRKLGDISHEVRVASIAEKLFDVTRRWHELGLVERRLLRLGAIAHDVGRCAGGKGHAKEGARMLLANSALPLSDAERRRIAFLVHYHRGHVDDAGSEHYLTGADVPSTWRLVLGFLRATDALDSRSRMPPQLVFTTRERTLTVFGYFVRSGTDIDCFGKRKKLRLLEAELNCEIRTQWFNTEDVALVS